MTMNLMRMQNVLWRLAMYALVCMTLPAATALAQSNNNWQQQQWQRQQDQQRQQQQAQQRQQMQDQQRQQMQTQQRQQMQEQMRQQQQQQVRQRLQEQQRQQMQTQQRQATQAQQQSKLGTLQPGTNKPTGMVVSGGVAKMNRPLTAGEIQRGFTGRVTTDGKALIKFQNRIFTVPASRVSGLSARLATQQNQRATRWNAQQQTAVSQRVAALASGGGSGGPHCGVSGKPPCRTGEGGPSASDIPRCSPVGSLKCQFNQAANPVQARIEAAKLARAGADNDVKPSVAMSGTVANMPHDFKKQAEAKKADDPTATRLPYDSMARAREVRLRSETKFVRVHVDGNQARSWMMRSDEIVGLTPAQIKDKFALPEIPKYVSDVNVPAGTRIRVGKVEGHPGWGAGGGTQYELKDKLPKEAFTNQRLLPP